MRAQVTVDGYSAYIFVNYDTGVIKVSSKKGKLDLTMDDLNNHDGDFCDFLSQKLTQAQTGDWTL